MGSDLWGTPIGVVRGALAWLGIDRFELDAAASAHQRHADRWIDAKQDAFKVEWTARYVWLNPPFSKSGGGKDAWIARAFEQAAKHRSIVALYLPVYADAAIAELDARAPKLTIAGRVHHVAPEGVVGGRPDRHQHAIWFVGAPLEPPRVWCWRSERFLFEQVSPERANADNGVKNNQVANGAQRANADNGDVAAAVASDGEQVLSSCSSIVSAGVASNTSRTYGWAARRWRSFAGDRDVSPTLVAAFVAELHREGLTPASVRVAVAALATAYGPPARGPVVRAALRGLQRVSAHVPSRRAPLRRATLVAGLPADGRLAHLRDRALLLIGWSGALRRSELVALDVGAVRVVVEADAPRGLLVTVRRSKSSATAQEVPIPSGRAGVDPVAAWRAWIDARDDVDDDAPAFVSIDRHGRAGARLSGAAVGPIVVACARRAGVDVDGIGAHSLRAGWITEAAIAGVPEWRIMQHSRHKSSETVRGYVRPATVWIGLPAFL